MLQPDRAPIEPVHDKNVVIPDDVRLPSPKDVRFLGKGAVTIFLAEGLKTDDQGRVDGLRYITPDDVHAMAEEEQGLVHEAFLEAMVTSGDQGTPNFYNTMLAYMLKQDVDVQHIQTDSSISIERGLPMTFGVIEATPPDTQ